MSKNIVPYTLLAVSILALAACASTPTAEPPVPVGKNQAALNEFNQYLEGPRTDYLRCAVTTGQGLLSQPHAPEHIALAAVGACTTELKAYESAVEGVVIRHGGDPRAAAYAGRSQGGELTEQARLAVVRLVKDKRQAK